MVAPATFTSTRARRVAPASQGSSCSRTASRPGFASPTALSIPPVNSATRGAGCPRRASGVTALVTIPPKASRSITRDTSRPNPAVPEARRTGFWKETPNSRCRDRQLALELEQIGDDAVGDRARDLVLAEARREERAVGAIRCEPGLDENRRPPGRREHGETRLLDAAVPAGMNPGRRVLYQAGELC